MNINFLTEKLSYSQICGKKFGTFYKKRRQSTLLEESPTCRLLESIHNTNLTGVLSAISDGARLLDGRQNALEYAIGKVSQKKNQKQAIEVCMYLMECHSEVLTENCANKIFEKNDKDLTNGMIQVLTVGNEELCDQVFRSMCSNIWDFPIARIYTCLPSRTNNFYDGYDPLSDARMAFGEHFVDKFEYFTKHGFGKVLPPETEINQELFETIK